MCYIVVQSLFSFPFQWKKHWFVLADQNLRYYRDSVAEEVSIFAPTMETAERVQVASGSPRPLSTTVSPGLQLLCLLMDIHIAILGSPVQIWWEV